MNDEEDPFKGLEDDDVEEDPVQTLGADLSILKERFADQTDADISLDEYIDFLIHMIDRDRTCFVFVLNIIIQI